MKCVRIFRVSFPVGIPNYMLLFGTKRLRWTWVLADPLS